MTEKIRETEHQPPESQEEVCSRRDFLIGLKKWSKIVIGGALFTATLAGNENEASAGWLNSRGGWINGGGWVNRGGSWANRAGGWVNGGGSWINGAGGGWANRRGGGGWLNAR